MGAEGTLILNKEAMKLVEITSERLIPQDKDTLKNIFLNRSSQVETQNSEISLLFALWHKYIPNHKQSPRCGACRSAVWAFWYKVNETYKK